MMLVIVNGLAQNELHEQYHLSLHDGQLIWQKVYDTDMTFEQLSQAVKASGRFDNIEIGSDVIHAELEYQSPLFQSLGYEIGFVPIYVSRNDIGGNATIQYKEGKYRVSMTDINYYQNEDDPFDKMGTIRDIEYYIYKEKKGKIRKAFNEKAQHITSYTLDQSFVFDTAAILTDDDW